MGRSAAFTGHSSGSSAPIGQIYYKPVTLQTLKNLKESKLEKGSKNYFKIFCIRQGTLFSLTTNESFSSEKGYVRSRLG